MAVWAGFDESSVALEAGALTGGQRWALKAIKRRL